MCTESVVASFSVSSLGDNLFFDLFLTSDPSDLDGISLGNFVLHDWARRYIFCVDL